MVGYKAEGTVRTSVPLATCDRLSSGGRSASVGRGWPGWGSGESVRSEGSKRGWIFLVVKRYGICGVNRVFQGRVDWANMFLDDFAFG